jgi:hypothetical protein
MTNFLKVVLVICLVLAAGATCLAAEKKPGFLRVEGDRVVDSSGAEVVLRGLNVEFKNFLDVLDKRDIARIAGSGANTIRLALDYRDFEPEPFRYREESFALLEQILDWCEEHRVYVILDMHLAPGKQNAHDFVVHRQVQALFWQDRQRQERFYALWAEIARRAVDRWIIAGYDLLNEGTPETSSQYQEVMTAAAARIRAVDQKHILIVEEAILPGWQKQLLLIDDPNVLYSVHFFHPHQFTFYATTSSRPVTSYPGEMFKAGQSISSNRARVGRGAGDWRRIEVKASPPAGAELLLVTVYSEKNSGQVRFDDLHLEINGRAIDLPAPLVANNSFEIDYPGFNWITRGDCVFLDHGNARTGSRALRFAGCNQPAAARSSPIPVKEGEYVLSGWYKADGAAGGTAGISLNWHHKRSIGRIDREALLDELRYALAFKKLHGVPLYVGEFTMHANPWPESAGRYLRDLLGIMEAEGLHWTFWEYYSEYPGVGLWRGTPPVIGNPVALEVLEEYFRPR